MCVLKRGIGVRFVGDFEYMMMQVGGGGVGEVCEGRGWGY